MKGMKNMKWRGYVNKIGGLFLSNYVNNIYNIWDCYFFTSWPSCSSWFLKSICIYLCTKNGMMNACLQ